ncbi:MAG: riboflavin synthase [Candidatus Peribacteraceae bacterium]
MFTGIIEATAEVRGVDAGSIVLARPPSFDDLKMGCSIAISGVCLSVTHFDNASMSFDLAETTVEKTTLGSLHTGDRVNLERAMKASDRLEGHIVQGHVEGVGTVTKIDGERFSVRIPRSLLPFIVHHGSITIDGVSLTVADLKGDIVTAAIIPLTKEGTTLWLKKVGDRINIETDILAKYVLQHAAR